MLEGADPVTGYAVPVLFVAVLTIVGQVVRLDNLLRPWDVPLWRRLSFERWLRRGARFMVKQETTPVSSSAGRNRPPTARRHDPSTCENCSPGRGGNTPTGGY